MSRAAQIRFPIGTKLIGMLLFLLLGSGATLVWTSTKLFISDSTLMIQQLNSETAEALAGRLQDYCGNIAEKMRFFAAQALAESPTRIPMANRPTPGREAFEQDKDLLMLFVLDERANAHTLAGRYFNPVFETQGPALWESLKQNKALSLEALARGESQLARATLADGQPAIWIAIPLIEGVASKQFTHTVVGLVRNEQLAKPFLNTKSVTAYLVDRRGHILSHPDTTLAENAEDVSSFPVVAEMLKGQLTNQQTRFHDPQSGEPKLGTFQMVGFGGIAVITEVSEAKAFESARRVGYRSLLIAGIILGIAVALGHFFADSISRRLKVMVKAAHFISEGDFSVRLAPQARDEITALSTAFNDMAHGLEEREKMKQVITKFHNKEVADQILSGEVKMGGERKDAIIFFSDIRDFTTLAESVQPEKVVEMLNEYLTSMVSVIRSHGGIVDKYVGDAIMAIWGLPLGKPDDARNAVMACLKMRQSLEDLNQKRRSRGHSPLKIGMGLNFGPVIAGNIGSDEKMEYTVIGDSVNLAARVESLTKELETDLLISQSLREKLGDEFQVESCGQVSVKGKTTQVEVFKVLGLTGTRSQAA